MSVKVGIIGSGNIGTDLMIKVLRHSNVLEMGAFVGVDATSEGLARAKRMGVPTTDRGIDGMVGMATFDDIRVVFDATSAKDHHHNSDLLRKHGKQVIDLTPAAIGPYVVPVVNLTEHSDAPNLNMVSCGGQATIPIVAAVKCISDVHYAEIVSSIASKSAGPGTRANIDEFTHTTGRAIEKIGGATRGKAIIVLNPAEPPLVMRNTVFCFTDEADQDAIVASINGMVEQVRNYVPGYRLKQAVQFESYSGRRILCKERNEPVRGLKISVFLEIEGAGHYLPPYAGNLDIMTSAALRTAERLVELKYESDSNGHH